MSSFGLSDEPWETLDREELLVPVAYALDGGWNVELTQSLENGTLLLRDEVGYSPWRELGRKAIELFEPEQPSVGLVVLYHHWQLISLHHLIQAFQPNLPIAALGNGLDRFFAIRAELSAIPDSDQREQLRALASHQRARELLLVRVQNFFVPRLRGGRYQSGPVLGLTDDAHKWTVEQREGFDFAAAATDCGVAADDLADLSAEFAAAGQLLDPAWELFHLLDAVRPHLRERITGDLQRAFDLYDAARVMRGWHGRVAGDPVPDVDALGGWTDDLKRRVYRTTNLRANRAALPAILEKYGLYPWRVQVIGEGDSELAALEEVLKLATGSDFPTLGISTLDVGGADLPAKTERLLSSHRLYANYFLLVFDNEGRARDVIEGLLRAHVIEGVSDQYRADLLKQAAAAVRAKNFESKTEQRAALRAASDKANQLEQPPGAAPEFLLWKENLEADNFDREEICQTIEARARIEGVPEFSLPVKELDDALAEEETKTLRKRRGVASVAVDLAKKKGFEIGKPELARLLAAYAWEHQEHRGTKRPLLDLAEHLYRLAHADRRLAGRLRW
jgi:hypothetical protein